MAGGALRCGPAVALLWRLVLRPGWSTMPGPAPLLRCGGC